MQARANSFEFVPLAPNVAAEVRGIDLRDELSDATIAAVRAALGRHGVLFFRNQDVSPADHVAFARRFGPIVVNKYFHGANGFPEIANVRRDPTDRQVTGGYWHTDHSYDLAPAMGSVFVAWHVPPHGGDTLFAGMAAAYAALSDGLKSVLEGLCAIHSDAVCPEVAIPEIQSDFDGRLKFDGVPSVRTRHPVVVRHPISGAKVLYVNSGFTERFDGWTIEESRPLLNYLFDHGGRPEFTYRHRWRPGDVAFWDNRVIWHRALDDTPGQRRELHRITIEGEELAAA